jgi:hypothetical protein
LREPKGKVSKGERKTVKCSFEHRGSCETPEKERNRNLNREIWEPLPFYGGEDVNVDVVTSNKPLKKPLNFIKGLFW